MRYGCPLFRQKYLGSLKGRSLISAIEAYLQDQVILHSSFYVVISTSGVCLSESYYASTISYIPFTNYRSCLVGVVVIIDIDASFFSENVRRIAVKSLLQPKLQNEIVNST